MGLLIRDRLMPVAPTPGRNRRQCAGVTVLCRYLPHHILARPRLAPDVGKAEEGERGTIRLRMVSWRFRAMPDRRSDAMPDAIPTRSRTAFRYEAGHHSKMKPDAVPT